jgi:phosphohistidine phosphatase
MQVRDSFYLGKLHIGINHFKNFFLKSLLLVRHAKSDWNDPLLEDFDRPLNERGKRDAPVMAHRLLDNKIAIDAFISSPAKRARKTAEIIAKEFGVKKEGIILIENLYLAVTEIFFDVIGQADDKFKTIAVFSHNPGITDFANLLTNARIDNIPTCGIFAVNIKTNHWKDLRNAEKEFWFFDYPRAMSSPA